MILERFVCGRSRSNTYLVAPEAPGPAFVVDAGPTSAGRVRARAEALDLAPEAVLLTHAHPDHVWDVRAYGLPVYVHPDDVPWLEDPATGGTIPGLRVAGRAFTRLRPLRPRDLRPLEPGELTVAGLNVRVLHTPGHTPGGVCLLVGDEDCFTGDVVFAGGMGHTGYPGGNRRVLRGSAERLATLADAVRLHPGHGPSTTVGQARGFLDDFVRG